MNTFGLMSLNGPVSASSLVPPTGASGSGSASAVDRNSISRYVPDAILEEEAAAKRRGRSPSAHAHVPGSSGSSKGIAIINITSFVVLVQPRGPGEDAEAPREDTVLDGTLEIVMDKPRLVKAIRVSLVAVCRMQIPGKDDWIEKNIFERSVEIKTDAHSHTQPPTRQNSHDHTLPRGYLDAGAAHADASNGTAGRSPLLTPNSIDESSALAPTPTGIRLEKGSQTFSWSIILPSSIATYDKHPLARISHSLKAVVEGFPAEKHSSSAFSLFSGIGKGKGREYSRSRPGSRAPSAPGSRAPSPGPSGSGHGRNKSKERGRSERSAAHTPNIPSSRSRAASRAPSPSSRHSGNSDRSPRASIFPSGSAQDLVDSLNEAVEREREQRAGRSRTPIAPPSIPLPTFGLGHGHSHSSHRSSSRHQDSNHNHSSHPRDQSSQAQAPEYKPLKHNITAERHIVVAANPLSIENLRNYSLNKTGQLAGVGEWKWSVSSDALTVGSYIHSKLVFMSVSPLATIFAVRLLLAQSYSLVPLNEPEGAALIPCPKRNFIIATEGTIPHEKRPGKDVAALYRGPDVGKSKDAALSENRWRDDFKLRIGMKRLPDDTKARPSTMEGTITPVRVSHEFVLQVFFAVDGTDLSGNPEASNTSGPGVMRMMMVTTPVTLPSCCCTKERIDLPEYSEAPPAQPPRVDHSLICACGHTLDSLAKRELQQLDEQGDELDLDIDNLALDENGRPRHVRQRPKAHFERSPSGGPSVSRSQR